MGVAGWENPFEVSPRKVRARRLSMAFCAVFFPLLGLAMLGMWSRVKITVRYGPGWLVACVALVLYLAAFAWGFRQELRARLDSNGGASRRGLVGNILGGLLGLGALAGFAVYGGAPIVAHYLTARPGEMTVTVARKESTYRRSACTPRLIIQELTFFTSNYVCPGSRAFGELDVGSKIRLEGKVSPFGVTVERYSWKSRRAARP